MFRYLQGFMHPRKISSINSICCYSPQNIAENQSIFDFDIWNFQNHQLDTGKNVAKQASNYSEYHNLLVNMAGNSPLIQISRPLFLSKFRITQLTVTTRRVPYQLEVGFFAGHL